MRCPQGHFGTGSMGTMAGPAVVSSRLDHPRANGIEFYVSQALQEVLASLDDVGLETPFKERPCPLVSMVEIRYIVPTDVLHTTGNRPLLTRRGQEVEVIGHEDPRMDVNAKPVLAFQ